MKSILFFLLLIAAQANAFTVLFDRSGETDSSSYGTQILPLGDQNDDGFNDWAVQARGNGGGFGGQQVAYLEFFHGGNPLSNQPYMTYRAQSGVTWQSYLTGDVNGDGYQDWWARGDLFFGGPQVDTIPDMAFAPSGGFFEGSIGDFNGDNYSDLYTYNFQTDVLRIFYGSNPMDTLPEWILFTPPTGFIQSIPYAHGDFNGDGASDFMCFNPNNRHIAFFLGGANPDTIPAYSWTFPSVVWPTGGVKSINGDSADEFLLDEVAGRRDIHFGRPVLSQNSDAFVNTSCQPSEQWKAVSMGDYNHDGYNDFILFTPTCVNNMFGSLSLYLGHPWIYSNPAFVIDGWSEPLNLIGIYTAAGLGDVNGDGIDDIAIGAWDDFAYLGWRGRCVILAGDASLIASVENLRPEIPQEFSVSVYPNPFNSQTTIHLEVPLSSEQTTLKIFNVLGQELQKITLPTFVGEYSYHFNASDLPTGIYLLRAESGNYTTTQKLVLLK